MIELIYSYIVACILAICQGVNEKYFYLNNSQIIGILVIDDSEVCNGSSCWESSAL